VTRAACTVVGGGRLEWQAGVVIHSQRSAHGIHPSLPAFAFIHQDRNCSQALFFSDGKREKKFYKSNTQCSAMRQNTMKTHQVGRSKLLCRQTLEEDQLQVAQQNTTQTLPANARRRSSSHTMHCKLSKTVARDNKIDLQGTEHNTNFCSKPLSASICPANHSSSFFHRAHTLKLCGTLFSIRAYPSRPISRPHFLRPFCDQPPLCGQRQSINSLSKHLQKTLFTRNA